MTLEQAYEKVRRMDEVLKADVLNNEEFDSVYERQRDLIETIGLEEQRQKKLMAYSPNHLSDWERGFLDGYVIQGHRLHHITEKQKAIFYAIGGWNSFQYRGYLFKFVLNSLLVEKIPEKSFLENF